MVSVCIYSNFQTGIWSLWWAVFPLCCHQGSLVTPAISIRGALKYPFSSVQFSRSCLTFCNPMDCSTPGLLVHHQLPEPTQIQVQGVGDAFQPSHPLSFPSPPAFNLSQHQSFPLSQLFALGSQSIGVSASASVFPVNIQGWFPLGLTGLISLQSKRLSRVFSSTTIRKHQFFGAQPSLWSNSHSRESVS